MESFEPKKLALLRIKQILEEYSDYDHPLTQEDIRELLNKNYDLDIERKAIGRNVSLLKEAGIEIGTKKKGIYLESRDFSDSEIRMLIDGVLSSKHITAKHSKDIIERLCGLSNKYFKAHVKHVYSVDDWSKTDNQALFLNIEMIDLAIEEGKQIQYNYNKYGEDGKLHKSSFQIVSPYQLVLHNQRYYLMAYSEYWQNMIFHRLDHITGIQITEEKATNLRNLPGYENGIDYKVLASTMPYMYTDKPESITFTAKVEIIDQVIDWFGKEAKILPIKDDISIVQVLVKASPSAMEHWAMQYINYVEILQPAHLRTTIAEDLNKAIKKYR